MQPTTFAVGDHVLVHLTDADEPATGTVVDDYQELEAGDEGVEATFGRNWALL